MRYKLTLAILVSIFWLTGCGVRAQSAATATPSQIVIATSTQPFTQTAEPINTPTLHPPTPKPDETEEFPDDCFVPYYSWRETSPDGQWVASVCERTNPDGSLDDTFPPIDLHIRKQDGSKEWKVSFKDITGVDFITYTNKYGEDARFVSIPFPYHWYKDNRYLFIAPKAEISNDFSDGMGLYRFDTQTGKLSPFLPSGESSYNFAFSPNDEYYVYQYHLYPESLHIVTLETGNDQTLHLPKEGGAVSFLWSPDNSKFAFLFYSNRMKNNSLLLFDTETKTFTSLLEFSGATVEINHWESNTSLMLVKPDSPDEPLYTYSTVNAYSLNIITKEMHQILCSDAKEFVDNCVP